MQQIQTAFQIQYKVMDLPNVFINFAKPGYKAKAKEVTVVTQFGIVVTYYEIDTFAL